MPKENNSLPFNPAHTHPASISSVASSSAMSNKPTAKSSSQNRSAVEIEGIQSGGGGGGGTGAGAPEAMGLDEAGAGGEDSGKLSNKSDSSDVSKVHPAWKGFGKDSKGDDEQKAGVKDKAKL